MSKAEKMFNELGYKKNETTKNQITYVLQEYYYKTTIKFNLNSKDIFFWQHELKNKEIELTNVILGFRVFEAIHEQIKELGWLDE